VPPSARANLEQVAALAGVSRATVSRVANGWSSVDPVLRDRVQQAIDELGYVPNQAARSLATRRSDTVALVASEPDVRVFGDPFFGGIVRGVSQECMRAGMQMTLLMAQSFDDLTRIESYLRTAPVDGVLLISEHAQRDPLPDALRRANIPFVIGGRPFDEQTTSSYVDNDNVGGGRLAAEHLMARGCAVIGTVAGPRDMAAGIDRLAGFTAALGRRHRARRVEHADFTIQGGEAATERLLRRVPDLDAIFAASDLMALGALRALAAAGRRVPADVAVVGFDDIDEAANAQPALTTVRQETVLQGRAMVRLLLGNVRPGLLVEAVDGLPEPGAVDHVVLPVSLVVRDSA
jgi:DNA-binding LacI/PurR family transcriptional regulator